MSFKNQVASGLKWNILDTVAVKGFGFLVILLLTRLLSPDDFGVISIVTVFITIGTAIVDGGLGVSLIRDDEVNQEDFSTVFISNLGLGILLYVLLFFLAPAVSWFYERPEITLLIRVLGLNFIIMSFSVVQNNLLMKEMDFKKLTFAALPGTLIGGILGVSMAYSGYGVWSLVVMQLVTQLMKSIVVWVISKWRFPMVFSKLKFYRHFSFGYRLVLSNVLSLVFAELYALLIGKRFSVVILGYYNRAKTFTQFPVSMVGMVISKVSYPMLSSLKNEPGSVLVYYQKIIRSAFFLLGGIMVTLFVTADPLFNWLFTKEWAPFIPFFKILCISAVLIPIHEINLNVFKVFNRTDLLLKVEIVKKIFILIVFIIGYLKGMDSLLLAIVFFSYVALFVNSYYAGRLIQYDTITQLRHMLPTFIVSVLTSFIMFLISRYFENSMLVLQVILLGLLAMMFYISLSIIVQNRGMYEFIDLVFTVLKRK